MGRQVHVKIRKRPTDRDRRLKQESLDLRTPSGRRLPY